MMNLLVQTPDEILATLPKPKLACVTQFALASEDWLMLCAGFEDRAMAVLQNAIASGQSFKVLLITYEPLIPQNRADAIREILRSSRRQAGGTCLQSSGSGWIWQARCGETIRCKWKNCG